MTVCFYGTSDYLQDFIYFSKCGYKLVEDKSLPEFISQVDAELIISAFSVFTRLVRRLKKRVFRFAKSWFLFLNAFGIWRPLPSY